LLVGRNHLLLPERAAGKFETDRSLASARSVFPGNEPTSVTPLSQSANLRSKPVGPEEESTMGMVQTVTFPAGTPVSWPATRDLLASHRFAVQVSMIDGELAFPDEEPPENWRELRLATPEGMVVTARRERDQLVLVVWGNADAGLVQAWNAITWAFAEAGNGQIQTGDGLAQTAAEYMSRVDLPASLRGKPQSGGLGG